MRRLLLTALFVATPAFAQDDVKAADEWKKCVLEDVEGTPSLQTDITTLTQEAFASCKADEEFYKGSRPLKTQESDTILMRDQIAAEVMAKFGAPSANGISDIKKDIK